MKSLKEIINEKMKSGKLVKGTHVSLTDPNICDMIGSVGFDFIWIDTEHTYVSYRDVLIHLNAARAAGSHAIVRVPMHDFTAMKKILEMGPDGIVIPMIRNAAEANELISYTLYPPYGTRGFGPQRAIRYGADDSQEYVTKGHLNLCRFIQIEQKSAVDDLEEIVKNPYIDGYIIGPNDLSGSIGELGNMFGENNLELIKRAVKIIKATGKPIGVSVGSYDPDFLKQWRKLGMDIISSGADYNHVLVGARNTLKALDSVD